MPRPLIAGLCGLLALGLAGPATADATDPSDVLGTWSFQTKPYRDGACSMNGSMRLTPDDEPGVYGCEITAVETCTVWGRSVVVQSCTARRFGNQLSVRSTIEEMLESKFDLENAVASYAPDNFALTIKDPLLMYGALVSAVTAPVKFRRTVDGVS